MMYLQTTFFKGAVGSQPRSGFLSPIEVSEIAGKHKAGTARLYSHVMPADELASQRFLALIDA